MARRKIEKRTDRRYKGKVSIRAFKGRLSLRLPRSLFGGKQKIVAVGLVDNADNRRKAEKLAIDIERDVKADCFDRSLERYGLKLNEPNSFIPSSAPASSSLAELLETYIKIRQDFVAPSTWVIKYKRSLDRLKKSPFADLHAELSPEQSCEIYDWLVSEFARDTARDTLIILNKCFEWAIERGRIAILEPPLKGFAAKIFQTFTRIKPEINPFTSSERDLIIQAFEEIPNYRHWCGYVKFAFFTGCRPSEAIALTWDDIAPDFSFIRFHKTVVMKIEREGLKTQAQRIFPCNEQMKDILSCVYATSKNNNLFTNKKNQPLRDSFFIKYAWKKVLAHLAIAYRKPYSMRHTFITLCLDKGMNVKDVARLVGNSPKIIYEHYAGVRSHIEVPLF